MYAYRNPHYDQRGFFFGVPFAGALLGGLVGGAVGSALFFPRPRPYFYPPYPPYGPYPVPPPYGAYGYGYPLYK